MKIISSYIKTFNKVIWSEKIPFIYTLVLPVVIFFSTNYQVIFDKSQSLNGIISTTSNYLSYMIVATAVNGVLLQLINFREIGFLKTYTMISGGNRRYAVLGLVGSELIFGYICVLIFSLLIVVFYPTHFLQIIEIYTITYILASVPVFLFSVGGALLPVRYNTSNTLVNIFLVGMLALSAARRDTHSFIGEVLFGINPCDYVTQVFSVVKNLIEKYGSTPLYQFLAIFVLLLVFLGVGIFSSSRISINSKNMRN